MAAQARCASAARDASLVRVAAALVPQDALRERSLGAVRGQAVLLAERAQLRLGELLCQLHHPLAAVQLAPSPSCAGGWALRPCTTAHTQMLLQLLRLLLRLLLCLGGSGRRVGGGGVSHLPRLGRCARGRQLRCRGCSAREHRRSHPGLLCRRRQPPVCSAGWLDAAARARWRCAAHDVSRRCPRARRRLPVCCALPARLLPSRQRLGAALPGAGLLPALVGSHWVAPLGARDGPWHVLQALAPPLLLLRCGLRLWRRLMRRRLLLLLAVQACQRPFVGGPLLLAAAEVCTQGEWVVAGCRGVQRGHSRGGACE